MNTTIIRADQFEGRFERLLVDFGNLQQQVNALVGQIQSLQGSNGQPQGGTTGLVYTIAPVAISAGGSATGQTVYVLVGGSSVALPGTYTVYNQMAAPTVATSGKTIMLGANPDGTFTVITQSC